MQVLPVEKPIRQQRALLTAHQAIEIYSSKFLRTQSAGAPTSSLDLAKHYGVSPKAIRDVWTRRSWGFATQHLLSDPSSPSLTDVSQVYFEIL